jgi:hypothetical protein
MTAQPRGIGDNKGPSLVDLYFIDWVFGVLSSDMKLVAKLLTLTAVILQTANAAVLAKVLGVSVKSIKKHKAAPVKKGWLHTPPPEARRGGRGTRYEFLPGHPDHPKIPVNLTGVNWGKYRRILDATNALIGALVDEPCEETGEDLGVVSDKTGEDLSKPGKKIPEKSFPGFSENPNEINGGNSSSTILNLTELNWKGDPKALAQAAQQLLTHLRELDQWDVIAGPASHAGLLHSGQIQTWLESGADPNRDIIETVRVKRAYLHRQGKGHHVKSWDFFTKPIAEAKARRERGLPPVPLSEDEGNGHDDHSNDRDQVDAAGYATRNITVDGKGRIAIGEELRGDLRCDGYTDEQINWSLPRGWERAQEKSRGRDPKPLAILQGIRSALSFIKQDAGKQNSASGIKRHGHRSL